MSDSGSAGSSRVHLQTLFRLADLPPIENPDLAAVATRFPHAVLCLISALDWHGITTQIPHQVHLSLARDARLPVLRAGLQ